MKLNIKCGNNYLIEKLGFSPFTPEFDLGVKIEVEHLKENKYG